MNTHVLSRPLASLALSISVLLRDNVPSAEPAAVRAAGGDDLRVSGMDRGDQGRKVSESERVRIEVSKVEKAIHRENYRLNH